MKNEKGHTTPTSEKPYNLFRQILEDQRRIEEAISNGVPLSSLKGIKFVNPLKY
jgi:hypothetical protein